MFKPHKKKGNENSRLKSINSNQFKLYRQFKCVDIFPSNFSGTKLKSDGFSCRCH